MSESNQLQREARQYLGFRALTADQERAVRAVLSGRDALVVIPTGSGKSAIYRLAARGMLPGPTVVVPPLIALEVDQAGGIDARTSAMPRW